MPSHDEFRFCPRCGAELAAAAPAAPEAPIARPTCGACGWVGYLDPKVAACAVCLYEGGVVLLRRGIDPEKGRWVIPGGYVDRGEPVAEAAVRETREEAHLRVALLGILDVYSFPGDPVVVVVYAADVLGGKLTAGDECSEARAFPPEEIPWDELAFASTRAALKDYLRRYFPRVRVPRP